MSFNYRPIRTQLAMLSALLAMVLIAVYSFVFFNAEKTRVYQASELEVEILDRALSNDYASFLLMGLPSDSVEIIHKWRTFPMILHVDLKNVSGASILHYSRDNEQHVEGMNERLLHEGSTHWNYKRTVVEDGETLGEVSYIISRDRHLQLLDQLVEILLISLPVILLLSVGLAVWLQRFFVRPLSDMMGGVDRILKEGDFDAQLEIKKQDKSEFARLGRSFNELIRFMRINLKEVEKAQLEAQQMANFDELTGLPNRRLLMDRMNVMLSSAKRKKRFGSVIFMDLDHFKTLNDSKGHAAGDELLKQVASRLQSVFRTEDTVARLGGDEFVILSGQLEETEDAVISQIHSLMLKLQHVLGEHFSILAETHHLSASFGVTIFPSHSMTSADLMKQADTAMYRAKELGRNGYQFYQVEMQEIADKRLRMEKELRDAIPQNEFELYYQPQVDEFGRIVGTEALLRWYHAEAMVSPAEFIPVAEQTGLIIPIGEWVLRTACMQLKAWTDAGKGDLNVSVNISPYQFRHPDFISDVKTLITETGVNPNRLVFEVTEGVIIRDVEAVSTRMKELTDLGIRLSMDDFGTGYSSLMYLKKLPLSELKIDQSFVRDLDVDIGDAEIAATIIAMTKNLNLDVVAEGVESEEQFDFLQKHGCLTFQGYFFYKPMPARSMTEILLSNAVSI